jgi:hypothetical protein
MWLKKTVPFLLAFLILNVSVFAQEEIKKLGEDGLPTYEYSNYLMQNNSELVWSMIKKLYSIEHSYPEFTFPSLKIIETKKNETIIGYDSPVLTLNLGIAPYIISYDYTLTPSVIRGVLKESNTIFDSVVWKAGAPILTFFIGFFTGKL